MGEDKTSKRKVVTLTVITTVRGTSSESPWGWEGRGGQGRGDQTVPLETASSTSLKEEDAYE